MSLPRPVLNRLLQLREPNDKSFSDVILRLAKE
jgi:predicted CopG family antitoxin